MANEINGIHFTKFPFYYNYNMSGKVSFFLNSIKLGCLISVALTNTFFKLAETLQRHTISLIHTLILRLYNLFKMADYVSSETKGDFRL